MMILKIFFIISLSKIFKLESTVQKCRILALQGGGDKGPYQAGAFKAIIETLSPEESQYDVFTGVSVGSLNAGALSLFEKGQEKESSEFIISLWDQIKSKYSIYEKESDLMIIYNIILGRSVFNTAPLKEFLISAIGNKTVKRRASFGATNYNTGLYQDIRVNESTSTEDLIHAVLSSSAMEVFLTPRNYNNQTYGDGGLLTDFDIPAGVNICREQGFIDENIIADVILLSPLDGPLEKVNASSFDTEDSLKRAKAIYKNSNDRRDLSEMRILFPSVKIRFVFGPETGLEHEEFPIVFNPEIMKLDYEKGYNQTLEILKNYPEGNYDHDNGIIHH